MSKCARQSADDLETKPLPQSDRRFVCGHNKVELHCAKTEPARFVQAMFAHCAANPLSLRIRRDHECRVRHVGTRSQLIRFQNVSANNAPVAFRDISMRVGPEPIRQRILARHLRIERIGVGGSNYIMKNSPDRVAIRFYRWANLEHGDNKRLRWVKMDIAPKRQPSFFLLSKDKLVRASFTAAFSYFLIGHAPCVGANSRATPRFNLQIRRAVFVDCCVGDKLAIALDACFPATAQWLKTGADDHHLVMKQVAELVRVPSLPSPIDALNQDADLFNGGIHFHGQTANQMRRGARVQPFTCSQT
jgi:hypothetical protein